MGGLSPLQRLLLADDEIEALWRGALSSDAAQGGELEEIKP
jgi:hypothetical protein